MKTSDFSQLELMREGIGLRFEISLRAFKVQVRPLTNIEIIQATADAGKAFNALPEDQRLNVSASLLNAMYQLEKASAKDVGELGELTLPLLQMMSPDEINHLWKQYVRITDKVNPSFEEATADQLSVWAEELKKNSDPKSLLIDLSISNLISLCLHLSLTSEKSLAAN